MKKVSYLIDGEPTRYSNLRELGLHLNLMSARDRWFYDGVLVLRETSSCISCTHEIIVNHKSIRFRPLRKIRLA